MNRDNPHVLILSGGLGTRSANPNLPKVLQKIHGELDLLELHLLNCLRAKLTEVTFLLGKGANQVIDRILQLRDKFPTLNLTWLIDDAPRGTSAAVYKAITHFSDSQNFLLILGDTAIQGNLSHFISRSRELGGNVVVACHPNLHPEDSDCVSYDDNGKILLFKQKKADLKQYEEGHWRAVTGLTFLKRDGISGSAVIDSDVTADLILNGIKSDSARALNSSMYIKDSGTPERLKKIRQDFNSLAAENRGRDRRSAIFLDRDGTIIPDSGTARKNVHDSEIEPETIDAIAFANNSGIPVFVITNQPGISKGEITRRDVHIVQAQIEAKLSNSGAIVDDFCYCPHHPDKGFEGEITSLKIKCECRKPKSGMLEQISKVHQIQLETSFVIGDSERDRGAAHAAGATFLHAEFKVKNSVAFAIRFAAERIVHDYHTNSFSS